MASTHIRRGSGRAALPRRHTKGPLDSDDEYVFIGKKSFVSAELLTLTCSPLTASASSMEADKSATSPLTGIDDQKRDSADLSSASKGDSPAISQHAANKDLSFLLDTSIYHPLGQLSIPSALRKPFPPPPPAGTTVNQIFAQLESLLAECHFLGAAHLAGLALTSGVTPATDSVSIFKLLAIRYSSLELSGNIMLAAQESKALEDLASGFYFEEDTLPENTAHLPENERPLPKHIMPFELRLQALRLQSIGFSDPRRGVSALYDVGLECREHRSITSSSPEEIELWSSRLTEVGIRVVNALIEMGDHDCALRTLESLKTTSDHSVWLSRMVLLLTKMGHLSKARQILEEHDLQQPEKDVLNSILLVAEGCYEDAAANLDRIAGNVNSSTNTIAVQNLAVAYLYTGQVSKCRRLLEGLVAEQQSFQTVTVNLATVYELSSDKAQDLKVALTKTIANRNQGQRPRAFSNTDFKI